MMLPLIRSVDVDGIDNVTVFVSPKQTIVLQRQRGHDLQATNDRHLVRPVHRHHVDLPLNGLERAA